jgi:hypothetical protein
VNPVLRVVLVVGLVCGQCGLLVWFAGVGYEGNPYPGGEELADDYGAYLGEDVVVYGQVADTDPLVIEYEDDGRIVEFRVTDVETTVEEGAYIEVYATARSGRVLVAIDAVRYPERGHWYAYGISALAALLTGARLIRDWTVDRRTFGLVRRDDA